MSQSCGHSQFTQSPEGTILHNSISVRDGLDESSNRDQPLVYFRYSDTNMPGKCCEVESDDCCSKKCSLCCPPCACSAKLKPSCPPHVKMSCIPPPSSAEWKRFCRLKQLWSCKKGICPSQTPSVSCHINNKCSTQCINMAADEICARSMGLPTQVDNIRPILDPTCWRVTRVMTSVATTCPDCSSCEQNNCLGLHLNFGLEYCGPRQDGIGTQPMYYASQNESVTGVQGNGEMGRYGPPEEFFQQREPSVVSSHHSAGPSYATKPTNNQTIAPTYAQSQKSSSSARSGSGYPNSTVAASRLTGEQIAHLDNESIASGADYVLSRIETMLSNKQPNSSRQSSPLDYEKPSSHNSKVTRTSHPPTASGGTRNNSQIASGYVHPNSRNTNTSKSQQYNEKSNNLAMAKKS